MSEASNNTQFLSDSSLLWRLIIGRGCSNAITTGFLGVGGFRAE